MLSGPRGLARFPVRLLSALMFGLVALLIMGSVAAQTAYNV